MKSIRERLISNTRKLNDTHCWHWTGLVSNSGYGRLMLPGIDGGLRMESAHRASYVAFKGQIPTDKRIVQTCANLLCVNPDHLKIQE